MGRTNMGLTDAKVRALKPAAKTYNMSDIRGLYLVVLPSGRKIWRMRYTTLEGKRTWYTMGEYPVMSIATAREQLPFFRQRAAEGFPETEEAEAEDLRFCIFAEKWAADHDSRLSTQQGREKTRQRMNNHIIPDLGEMIITDIKPKDVLAIMQRLAAQEKFDMMPRVRAIISMIFRFAAANGYDVTDPTTALRGAITAPKAKHFSSMRTKADVKRLLVAISNYPTIQLRNAMLFSAYTFCRPGEIRQAEWQEIDAEAAEWRIPETKMKMRRPHIVPLSTQALAILERMRPATGHGRYVFPNLRTPDGSRPMSEVAVLSALRAMGFTKDEMTAHGFRSMASTILNENGFNSDWIERQLAHVEGNKVRAAYNYADYLADRRGMMQWYADYLDSLVAPKDQNALPPIRIIQRYNDADSFNNDADDGSDRR